LQVSAAREEVAALQAALREERARQAAHAATVALVARCAASPASPFTQRARHETASADCIPAATASGRCWLRIWGTWPRAPAPTPRVRDLPQPQPLLCLHAPRRADFALGALILA
jgi:hypothetical protein